MIVLKFGGSSVRDAAMIDQALAVTHAQLDRAPLLVASAMGKTTDTLVAIGNHAVNGEAAQAFECVTELYNHHRRTAELLLGEPAAAETIDRLDSLFGELQSLVRGLCLIREVTPRTSDTLVAFGELLSTTLIAARSNALGVPTVRLDSRLLVKTDAGHGRAAVLDGETTQAIRNAVTPMPGHLFVAQGFIGSTMAGQTTTLGRGGSDYSATIFGAALAAEEVQIWTDVDGIMTTDPRVIAEAAPIAEISYAEAAELSYFGAKVIHPSTIQPAIERRIPVWVKNTHNPRAPGTRIVAETAARGVRAIAGKTAVTVVTVESSRMLDAFGFLRGIFAIFERLRISIDLVATSEVSVSMSIDDPQRLAAATAELSQLGRVSVEHDKAIVCLVGHDLWKDASFSARVFVALAEIPVRMISLGASDTNLSLVVAAADLETAIRRLHRAFFGAAGTT